MRQDWPTGQLHVTKIVSADAGQSMYRHDNAMLTRIEREAMGAHLASYAGTLRRWGMGMPKKFHKNGEIFVETEPVDYVYEVAHGAVRTVKVLSDGRRLIGSFYFSGDIFGLEDGSEHSFSAEAIADSTILIIRRDTLISMAGHDRELAQQLMTMIMRQIARAQNHALMLVKLAPECVGSFLLEMAERISIGDRIELPMSRQDIADHLGLTIETVCRTLTNLENTSAIVLPTSRAVVLRNRSALAEQRVLRFANVKSERRMCELGRRAHARLPACRIDLAQCADEWP